MPNGQKAGVGRKTVGVPAAVLAPGLRVEIRDAEWVVRRADILPDGSYSVLVTGISELVRGRDARFLSGLERITPLRPEDTSLVYDTSAQFAATRLYLESLLRLSPATGEQICVGDRAAMDLLPYQLDPALQALGQIRQRILMADTVGLGKTLEAAILVAELMRRGRARRVLVVTTRAMMQQYQKELWTRFAIPLVRLDRTGIERIREQVPAGANPFDYYDKTIVSVDTLKQDKSYREHLKNSYWDVIVIDEAHNVAVRGSKSARARLAELLASRSDTLILASATPHDGKPESFASLMNMLDPTAIANPSQYGPEDVKGLFIRRFKGNVRGQMQGGLKDRRTVCERVAASAEEEAAYAVLQDLKFHSFDQAKRMPGRLFATILEKSLFSSPAACRATIRERLKKLEAKTGPDAEHDRGELRRLDKEVEAITPEAFSRYQALLGMLRAGGGLDFDARRAGDRLVIFTERIETLKFLSEHLRRDLGLGANQIATLDGQSVDDRALQETVEAFGRDGAPVRVLIATDIASEGLNLHYLSHKLVHFDLPWSLMKFQQRNGRIDRYGQAHEPVIVYLETDSLNEKIRGDVRYLEILREKDEQAQKNINDPSALTGWDEKQEELATAQAMEEGLTPEAFAQRLSATAGETDWLAILQGGAGRAQPSAVSRQPSAIDGSGATPTERLASVFASDLEYVKVGLKQLSGGEERLDYSSDEGRQMVSLTVPEDLGLTLRRVLPKAALPANGRLHWTADRDAVQRAIAATRAGEAEWPQLQLLWDLHPAMEWLNYQLLVSFGRWQAPVAVLHGALGPDEIVFLMQGEISNRRAQPVVYATFGVRFVAGAFAGVETLAALLERTGLGRRAFANPGIEPELNGPRTLLAEAVERGRAHMSELHRAAVARLEPRRDEATGRLERLRQAQRGHLEAEYGAEELAGVRKNRKEARARQIEALFASHQAFVRDSLTTEDAPFLRVAAVLLGS